MIDIDTPNKNIQESERGSTPTASSNPVSPQSAVQTGQSGSATRQVYESSTGRVRETETRSIKNMGTEVKERASQAKDTFSEGWDHAMDYSRTHPAQATLIAFGAGIGFGLLLAGNLHSRNRTRRIVPPVINALSEIAREVFR